MKNIAVILAGGSGRRLGASMPKQFLEISGQTVLGYTLGRFNACAEIDEMCVVVHPDHIDDAQRIIDSAALTKPCVVLTGGKERYHSSLSAIEYCVRLYGEVSDINLLFHDAVRPMISSDTISEVVAAMCVNDAVCVAVPSTDTLLRADADGNIVDIPNRSCMWNAQTPQGFRLDVISGAYKLAMADPDFTTTDDCGVILHYRPDVKIKIVSGSPENIKLTYAADIERLRHLLS